MKSIALKEFKAFISLERSMLPNMEPLGEYNCTMELYDTGRRGQYFIEWDIPDLDECECIGIWVDNNKKVTDYDGVFSMPDEAIQLLKENGFDTSEIEN